MKKLILMVTLVFVMGMSAPVMAMDMDTRMDKLTNGFMDVISSPLLIVTHPMEKMEDDGGMGLLKGLVEMPFKFVGKLGHGIVDVVTFPVVE